MIVLHALQKTFVRADNFEPITEDNSLLLEVWSLNNAISVCIHQRIDILTAVSQSKYITNAVSTGHDLKKAATEAEPAFSRVIAALRASR